LVLLEWIEICYNIRHYISGGNLLDNELEGGDQGTILIPSLGVKFLTKCDSKE